MVEMLSQTLLSILRSWVKYEICYYTQNYYGSQEGKMGRLIKGVRKENIK